MRMQSEVIPYSVLKPEDFLSENQGSDIRDARRRWAEELEGGDYEQADGVLRRVWTDDEGKESVKGFCCLGVACDVFGGGKWDVDEYVQDGEPFSGSSIPTPIRLRLGLSTRDLNELAALNDNGMPFSGMAIIIRQMELPGALIDGEYYSVTHSEERPE